MENNSKDKNSAIQYVAINGTKYEYISVNEIPEDILEIVIDKNDTKNSFLTPSASAVSALSPG